jgi:membrane associated rhomboid family serine protease
LFILPWEKEDEVLGTPWVVIGIVVLNTLAWIASYALPHKQLVQEYGFISADPLSLTVLSSMFLHAGFWHWAGNMWFLWMFGNQIEDSFGRFGFSLLYLVSGFGATLLQYLSDPGSTVPCIGASGAISGVVGAYFVLYPRNRFDLDVYFGRWRLHSMPTTARVAVGAWFAEQFLLGLVSRVSHFSAVAFWAHIGGFASGAMIAYAYTLLVPDEERCGNLVEAADTSLVSLDLVALPKRRARRKRGRH